MSGGGKWADLGPRLASGVILASVGLAAIWVGGPWFAALTTVAATLMTWELARMQAPDDRAGRTTPGADDTREQKRDWQAGLRVEFVDLDSCLHDLARGLVAVRLDRRLRE